MKLYAVAAVFWWILGFALVQPSASAAGKEETPKAEAVVFPKRKIKIAGKTIQVEIADNDGSRERGLMFRDALPEGHGMIFIFETERPLTFWMKNTLIPLSIGFYDREKKLVDSKEMVPAVIGAKTPTLYPSQADAMYAIEMPKGWFTRNKVKIGSTFSFVDKP